MESQKYDALKETGYEWLGDIPESWKLVKAKWLFKEKSVKGYPDERLLSVSKGKGLIPRDELEFKTVMAFKDLENFKLVKRNDFVIHLRSFQSGFEMSDITGIVSPAYTVFEGKATVYPYYYKYIFYMKHFIDAIASTTQSLRDGKPIAYGEFAKMELPLSSKEEQRKIFDFLNGKLQSIDKLISYKTDLINLLEEKRQAIITEAVTKGLNPDVKMKDSGVEWIDEIPDYWSLGKLKNLSSRIGDGLHGTPIYDDSGKYYFINGNNLGERNIVLKDETNTISEEEFTRYKKNLKKGSLLVSLNGTIGNISIYNEEPVMLSKSAGYINLTEQVEVEFVYYYLQSESVKIYFEQSFAGTTIKNLSLETLRNTKICLPPLEEQAKIATHIKSKMSDFKKLKDELNNQIESLREYRQSLIYEAVTGKIDVRDFEVVK